jgi:hypothetical protein
MQPWTMTSRCESSVTRGGPASSAVLDVLDVALGVAVAASGAVLLGVVVVVLDPPHAAATVTTTAAQNASAGFRMDALSTTLARVKRRLRQLAGISLFAVTLWLCIDNVFSDDAPIRALAEKAACDKRSANMKKDECAEQHGMTREQRYPWGQTLEYTWRDATIAVGCHRTYYVFGERRCAVE